MSELELIIVLDLDGTIIGNCCFQADLYNLQLIQKKYKIKQINSNILLKSYYNNSKLIRPYFLYFYNKLRHLYPKSYIYIYILHLKKNGHIKKLNILKKIYK